MADTLVLGANASRVRVQVPPPAPNNENPNPSPNGFGFGFIFIRYANTQRAPVKCLYFTGARHHLLGFCFQN